LGFKSHLQKEWSRVSDYLLFFTDFDVLAVYLSSSQLFDADRLIRESTYADTTFKVL